MDIDSGADISVIPDGEIHDVDLKFHNSSAKKM